MKLNRYKEMLEAVINSIQSPYPGLVTAPGTVARAGAVIQFGQAFHHQLMTRPKPRRDRPQANPSGNPSLYDNA